MIRIGKLTDYGIVLLTYFARHPTGAILTARSLAESARIPLPMVTKVLKTLCRGALLVSHRGVKGGFSLARAPDAVTIAEVVRVLEGPVAVTECSAAAPGLCDLEPQCPVRSNWLKINSAVIGALDGLTIVDMTSPLTERPAEPRVQASRLDAQAEAAAHRQQAARSLTGGLA